MLPRVQLPSVSPQILPLWKKLSIFILVTLFKFPNTFTLPTIVQNFIDRVLMDLNSSVIIFMFCLVIFSTDFFFFWLSETVVMWARYCIKEVKITFNFSYREMITYLYIISSELKNNSIRSRKQFLAPLYRYKQYNICLYK